MVFFSVAKLSFFSYLCCRDFGWFSEHFNEVVLTPHKIYTWSNNNINKCRVIMGWTLQGLVNIRLKFQCLTHAHNGSFVTTVNISQQSPLHMASVYTLTKMNTLTFLWHRTLKQYCINFDWISWCGINIDTTVFLHPLPARMFPKWFPCQVFPWVCSYSCKLIHFLTTLFPHKKAWLDVLFCKIFP